MGKRSISDLDKSKTEQSITNETIRLENCRQSLNELKNSRITQNSDLNESRAKYDRARFRKSTLRVEKNNVDSYINSIRKSIQETNFAIFKRF